MSQAEMHVFSVQVVCNHCGWSYWAGDEGLKRCPNCWSDQMEAAGNDGKAPAEGTPELVLPFSLDAVQLQARVEQFASGIPFAPADLTAKNLAGRAQRVFIPSWLVDIRVAADWQAEVGFNYQVVSHQDHFDENRGGWSSREVNEGRVRWEPRQGRLQRTYQNLTAPALQDQPNLYRRLGGFRVEDARPFVPDDVKASVVRQPDRARTDAWIDVQPAAQARAAEECRQASGADHIRNFRWLPEFSEQNWTQFLMPVFTAYYLDDANLPQPVHIHGQSGQIFGVRRASMQRAQRLSIIVLVVAVVLFILGGLLAAAGVVFPPALAFGGGLMLLAFFVGVGAIIPVGIAWQFNRK